MLEGVWRTCSDFVVNEWNANKYFILPHIPFKKEKWIIVNASWSQFYFLARQCNVKRWHRIENIDARCSIRTSHQLNTYRLIHEWHPLKLDSISIRLVHSIKTIWNSIVIWKFASVIFWKSIPWDHLWWQWQWQWQWRCCCVLCSILCWHTSLSQLFQQHSACTQIPNTNKNYSTLSWHEFEYAGKFYHLLFQVEVCLAIYWILG